MVNIPRTKHWRDQKPRVAEAIMSWLADNDPAWPPSSPPDASPAETHDHAAVPLAQSVPATATNGASGAGGAGAGTMPNGSTVANKKAVPLASVGMTATQHFRQLYFSGKLPEVCVCVERCRAHALQACLLRVCGLVRALCVGSVCVTTMWPM